MLIFILKFVPFATQTYIQPSKVIRPNTLPFWFLVALNLIEHPCCCCFLCPTTEENLQRLSDLSSEFFIPFLTIWQKHEEEIHKHVRHHNSEVLISNKCVLISNKCEKTSHSLTKFIFTIR